MGDGDQFVNGPKISNCVHASTVELLKNGGDTEGAAIYIMKGSASFDLKKFDMTADRPVKKEENSL